MNRFGLSSTYNVDEWNNKLEYVVKKGDSLYKISKEYGISINDLINANNLTNNMIYPNQVLVIPKRIDGNIYFEEYVIKPNDTLETISGKTSVSIDELSKYNDLSKLILIEDQILNIPRRTKTYVILKGDTLDSILDKTNLTLNELLDLNLDEWLKEGKTIIVK